jgi:hypothetical protein
MKLRFLLPLLLLATLPCFAAEYQRCVVMREGVIYVQPDTSSAKLSNITRGHELTLFEHANGWAHVTATVVEGGEFSSDRDISGWMLDQGIICANTPNGDQVLYGEAVDSEHQASTRNGRKGAADDAKRLYYRVAEYFPNSPLAGEALYRAADIQWQIDKEDQSTKRSAKSMNPGDRLPINEDLMKRVEKKFPGTKWAELAAFRRLDNKLCGDWNMEAKCPEKEAEMYEKYATEHPASPAAPEALYDAAWRWAALIQIYPIDAKANKVPEAKQHATAIARQLLAKNVSPDWNARAERLIYMVDNNIPTYGDKVQ